MQPCPFCKSTNIEYSIKVSSRTRTSSTYHMSMYCKNCFCYGPRILVKPKETRRIDIENNITYKQRAIDAWNRRR